MATFNGREYVEQQLRSIAAQTCPPDELVIADDGSSDGTLDLLEAFRRDAPFPVQLIVGEPRLGYMLNFDRALTACHGDIVFLSDQDDVWLPHKVERVLRAFAERPATGLIIHDCIIADADLAHEGATQLRNRGRMGRTTDDFVSGCCTAIRRGLLDALLPIPAAYDGHDTWLHGLAGLLGQRWVLPEALIYYRRHGRNLSSNPVASRVPVNRVLATLRVVAHRIRGYTPALHARHLAACEVRYQMVADRLASIATDPSRLPEIPSAVVGAAQARVLAWAVNTHVRVQALSLPRRRRVGAILKALARGHYVRFNLPGAIVMDLLAERDTTLNQDT